MRRRCSSATTTSGRSRRRSRRRRARKRSPTRRSATGFPVCASTASTCSRCSQRRAKRWSARAAATARRSSSVCTTADDPRAYIDQARVEEERANECVGRFERTLLEAGVLTPEHAAAVKKECEDLMRAGIAAAEAEPAPDPELVFTHAYVDPPGNMRRG